MRVRFGWKADIRAAASKLTQSRDCASRMSGPAKVRGYRAAYRVRMSLDPEFTNVCECCNLLKRLRNVLYRPKADIPST